MNYNFRDTALFVPRRAVARLRSSRIVLLGSNSFYRVSLQKKSEVHLVSLAMPLAYLGREGAWLVVRMVLSFLSATEV